MLSYVHIPHIISCIGYIKNGRIILLQKNISISEKLLSFVNIQTTIININPIPIIDILWVYSKS